MKKCVVGLFLFCLMCCAASEAGARPKDSTPLAKKPVYVEKAHEAIRGMLELPDTAEFKCDVSSSDENITGFVNARRADGSETGFKQFNVIFDKHGQVADSSVYAADVEPVLMNAFCNASKTGRFE